MNLKTLSAILVLIIAAFSIDGCVPASLIKLPTPIGNLNKNQVIEKYFKDRELDLVEGIWVWDNNAYEVAILKNSFNIYPQYDYIGVLTDSRREGWNLGETKLLLKRTVSDYAYSAVYFMGDKSEYGTTLTLPNENMVEMYLPTGPYGTKEKAFLIRTYPQKGSRSNSSSKGETTSKSGTGFFVSKDILATNYHIVADAKSITISWNERRLNATLLMKDQVNDLALLRLEFPSGDLERKLAMEQVSPLPIGDIRKVKDGDKVFTVGFPLTQELGKRARVSEGIVNSTVGVDDDPRMIQISVPIQPGNSGGPLFNVRGEVIGIVTSTINNAYLILQKGTFPQNVNFAVKINYLNNLVSLLPTETKLTEGGANKEQTAAEIMNATKNSVVYIEATN